MFCAKVVTILIIIVERGTLSTNVLANADTQSNSNIATANRDSSFTDRIIFSVCFPIQAIKPNRDKAWKSRNEINQSRFYLLFTACFPSTSIRTNKDAKNNKVLHSTRAIKPSKSSLSAKINNKRTPNRAVQPNDKCRFGTLCTKNNVITKINVNPDFTNNHLSRIGYCDKIKIEYDS